MQGVGEALEGKSASWSHRIKGKNGEFSQVIVRAWNASKSCSVMMLLGYNRAQRLVILDGESGRGKTQFANVMQGLVAMAAADY